MTQQQRVSSYVNGCIDNLSLGFTTDVNNIIVRTHVFYHLNIMVVGVKGQPAMEFDISDRNKIINYILIKTE